MFIALSLLAILGQNALAQPQTFKYHHQQAIMHDDVLLGIQNMRPFFKARALTPVQDIFNENWAFVAAVSEKDDENRIGLMLAKLGSNGATPKPFGFLRAQEYFLDRSEENIVSLDVKDVYYVEEGLEYIICGRAATWDGERGFLLLTDAIGDIIDAKIYTGVTTFNSVAPCRDGEGFVAVGVSSETRNAAYVSVDRALNVRCGLEMSGIFGYPLIPTRGKFHKVIPYETIVNGGRSEFAVVGQTYTHNNQDIGSCSAYGYITKALVAVVDDTCTVTFAKTYGSNSDRFAPTKTYELGLSIAQHNAGGRLVVTGYVYRGTVDYEACTTVDTAIEDILVILINPDGSHQWMRHYDVDGRRDMGMAVQSNGSEVFIAGTTKTTRGPNTGRRRAMEDAEADVGCQGNSTTNASSSSLHRNLRPRRNDRVWHITFHLRVEPESGIVRGMNLFYYGDHTPNGVLAEGGMDLHRTKDGNSVILANLDILQGRTVPYLVEYYSEQPQRHCYSSNQLPSRSYYAFLDYDAHYEDLEIGTQDVSLVSNDAKLFQQMQCPKIEVYLH